MLRLQKQLRCHSVTARLSTAKALNCQLLVRTSQSWAFSPLQSTQQQSSWTLHYEESRRKMFRNPYRIRPRNPYHPSGSTLRATRRSSGDLGARIAPAHKPQVHDFMAGWTQGASCFAGIISQVRFMDARSISRAMRAHTPLNGLAHVERELTWTNGVRGVTGEVILKPAARRPWASGAACVWRGSGTLR